MAFNRTKIDWPGLTHTWNPVVGCKHGCSYCYAERMNNRFGWIKDWTRPMLFIDRLYDPENKKKPCKVFVGSMCDLFGDWVPDYVIDLILDYCREAPWHEYMFLTKNPTRYKNFNFDSNMWIGATISGQPHLSRAYQMEYFRSRARKFLSIEPFLSKFEPGFCGFDHFDLVIIGGLTGPRPFKPPKQWIDNINHPNIHIKENAV